MISNFFALYDSCLMLLFGTRSGISGVSSYTSSCPSLLASSWLKSRMMSVMLVLAMKNWTPKLNSSILTVSSLFKSMNLSNS